MYPSKVCVQDFWHFVSGLDIQLEQSENNSPIRKKYQLQVEKYNESYTFFSEQVIIVLTNGLLVQVSRSE